VGHPLPNRAPHLSEDALHVLVGYSLVKGWTTFAHSLLLGFHGLLRTGELLGVQAEHVSVGNPKGPTVISLGLTKAGKRQAAAESVTLHAKDVCRRLYQWKSQVNGTALLTGPAHKWRKTFNEVITAVGFDCIDYRPYSLRRGGATHYFTLHGRFDSILILGRWQAAATARLCLNEGLATIAELSLPMTRFSKNLSIQYLSSLTKPLPKLELTKNPSQKRGRWKRAKNNTRGVSSMGEGLQLPWIWPGTEVTQIYLRQG